MYLFGGLLNWIGYSTEAETRSTLVSHKSNRSQKKTDVSAAIDENKVSKRTVFDAQAVDQRALSQTRKTHKKKKKKRATKSKKKGGIVQIQKAPTKSKRKRKIAKSPRMSKKKAQKSKQTKKKKNQKSEKYLSVGRKRQFAAIESVNMPHSNESQKKRRKVTVSDTNEKCVERIYGQRIENGKTEYLMKWKGMKVNQSTWTKSDNSAVCNVAIEQFKQNQQNSQRRTYMQRVVKGMSM